MGHHLTGDRMSGDESVGISPTSSQVGPRLMSARAREQEPYRLEIII